MRGASKSFCVIPSFSFGAFLFVLAAFGQNPQIEGDLRLAEFKDYKALRVSSNNPDPKSNDDSKRPVPGETIVMADLQGPGVITHIWTTVAAREYGWPRLLRLRIYYDGSPVPSVDAPLGDFFAVGHGMERSVNSAMIQNSSSGRSRNSYWPMPFRRSARLTLTNEGRERVANFYYHVDWRKVASLPDNIGYFHARYRQQHPVHKGDRYEFLSIRGRGHYVGTVLSVVQTEPGWFGEGDEYFVVDGEPQPSIEGTGSEDYFNNAWALRITEGPYTGAPVAENGTGTGARVCAYRWHLTDPIPFKESLRFDIEAAGWTYGPGGSVRSAFEPRSDLFSSVAFWYQEGIAKDFPEPPYGMARLPHGNALQIEVEQALASVKAEGGKAAVLKDAFWSRDLLTFEDARPGSKIAIPIEIEQSGRYEMIAQMAHSSNYGQYAAYLDGKPLAPEDLEHEPGANMEQTGQLNLWATELYVAEDHLLGWQQLEKGRHTITFVCSGKDARSSGYALGIDTLILARIDGVRSTPILEAVELHRIGEIGRDDANVVPRVVAGLRNRADEVREAAAWALTQANSAAAVTELTRALADSDPVVRDLAALALRNAGPAALPALPALTEALKDADANVRIMAAEAIARQGANALPALKQLIAAAQANNEQVHVLRSLASAMGAIGPGARDALPILEKLSKIPRVQWAAEAAMRQITRGTGVLP